MLRRLLKFAWSRISLSKSPFTSVGAFHEIIVLTFSLCGISISAMNITDAHKSHYSLCIIFHCIASFTALFGVLYFFNLSKDTGHYVLILEKLELDTLIFFSMGIFVFLACSSFFYLLHIPQYGDNQHSKSNGTIMFQDFLTSTYCTLLFSFGVIIPEDIYFSHSNYPLISQLTYICILLLLSVTILNMLIAVFSDRVAEINAFRNEVLQLQAMSLLVVMEESRKLLSSRMSPSALKRTSFVARRKHIVESDDNSSVYLHTLVENKCIKSCEKHASEILL